MLIEIILKLILFYGIVVGILWGVLPSDAKPLDPDIVEFNNLYAMNQLDIIRDELESPIHVGIPQYRNYEEIQDAVEELQTIQGLDAILSE